MLAVAFRCVPLTYTMITLQPATARAVQLRACVTYCSKYSPSYEVSIRIQERCGIRGNTVVPVILYIQYASRASYSKC